MFNLEEKLEMEDDSETSEIGEEAENEGLNLEEENVDNGDGDNEIAVKLSNILNK